VELGEIEFALATHSAVERAAVVAVPQEDVGHRLKAAVIAKPGVATDEAALKRHCASTLPSVHGSRNNRIPSESPAHRQREGGSSCVAATDDECFTACCKDRQTKPNPIEEAVRDFLVEDVFAGRNVSALRLDDSLFELELLDSIAIIKTVTFCEENFGILAF
jgi:acyl-CoA synthetase (AMP-forming)/AMP-acid ligase II